MFKESNMLGMCRFHCYKHITVLGYHIGLILMEPAIERMGTLALGTQLGRIVRDKEMDIEVRDNLGSLVRDKKLGSLAPDK